MRVQGFTRLVFLVLFFISSLGCNYVTQAFGGRPAAAGTNATQVAVTQVAATNTLLGEEFRSESGGFSLRKVNGYEFSEVIGIVNMVASDAEPEIGPVIMAAGGLNEVDMTVEALIEKARSETSAFTLSKEEKIKIGGQDGWQMTVTGTYDDLPVTGRTLVVMISPRQQFTLLAIGPAARWVELEPIYEAVIASVTFFEANPAAAEEPLPGEEPAATEPPTTQPTIEDPGESPVAGEELRQWAVSARAKTEYGRQDWSAMQAVGEPDVDECGDNVLAWAPLKPTGLDWLEVTFATPVTPTDSPNTYPSDYQLDTVNQEIYQQLDAIYKRDQVILYPVMANLLQSPGFLSEQVLREDGRMETNYSWYHANGDRIIGIFFDGKLTGMAGLALIPKQ